MGRVWTVSPVAPMTICYIHDEADPGVNVDGEMSEVSGVEDGERGGVWAGCWVTWFCPPGTQGGVYGGRVGGGFGHVSRRGLP